MGRKAEFNKEQVLEQVMNVFWLKGYSATSIQDLEKATGLKRGSIYGAFGNKKELFLMALDRYSQGFSRLKSDFDSLDESPLNKVKKILNFSMERALADEEGYCCLAMKTLLDIAGRDQDISHQVNHIMEDLENVFYDFLLEAQEIGELSMGKDPRGLSRFLIVFLNGLRVSAQIKPGRRFLEDCLTVAFDVLD